MNYRLAIAANAFEYMADRVFTPSEQSAENQAKGQEYLSSVWATGNPQWRSASEGVR